MALSALVGGVGIWLVVWVFAAPQLPDDRGLSAIVDLRQRERAALEELFPRVERGCPPFAGAEGGFIVTRDDDQGGFEIHASRSQTTVVMTPDGWNWRGILNETQPLPPCPARD